MSPNDRLESWKEIAAFMRRGVSTVQRWEREEGLPVRRLSHAKLGSVYAYRHELEAWRRGRSGGAGAPALERSGEVSCRLVWGDRQFPLQEGQNVIGRGADASVSLNHARVSRRHACITVLSGEATLEDMGSKNGTYVGRRRLQSAHPLANGDEILIGLVRMVYRSDRGDGSTETGSTGF